MKISELYEKYKIPQTLQEHMLRVAGVSAWIIEHFQLPVQKDLIIHAALLHDVGNILKIDFDTKYFDYTADEVEQYKKDKAYFSNLYGSDCDRMVNAIIESEHIIHAVLPIVNGFDLEKMNIIAKGSYEKQIVAYADLRVGPHGAISLPERFAYLVKRYPKLPVHLYIDDVKEIEANIFAHMDVSPDAISSEEIEKEKNSFLDTELILVS